MFSINCKFVKSDAEIFLKKAAMGQQFFPAQPILYLKIKIRNASAVDDLRKSLLDGLEPFTILNFKFLPLESKDVQLVVELGTSHQPDTILSVIELIIEKNKKVGLNAEAHTNEKGFWNSDCG